MRAWQCLAEWIHANLLNCEIMSKVIYRLRPFSENTLDEIINSYLWFSKPIGFKDDQDSNIKAYFDNCDILRKTLIVKD